MGDTHSLEDRIRYYETQEHDPGTLHRAEWLVLLVTGVVFPGLCLVLGWLIGW